jgi:tetratricopeptide (TPR) repeat protein
MTATKENDYRELESASSNLLMEWDGRWCLGRYEEATYAVWRAGRLRLRMGRLSFDAGNFTAAAEDWLSAAACFLEADAEERANEALQLVRELAAQGRLPAERTDLLAALREREEGLLQLRQEVQDFHARLLKHLLPSNPRDEDRLNFLVQQVREMPGYAPLHYQIYKLALKLGQDGLAAKHIRWAATFNPNSAEHETDAVAVGYRLIEAGKVEAAQKLGSDFLAENPGSGPVRIMLAKALTSYPNGRPPEREQAIALLRPLLDRSQPNVKTRTVALGLSAVFCYELGRQEEFARLLHEIEELENSDDDPWIQSVITDFRRLIPTPLNGATKPQNGLPEQLAESNRKLLFEKAEQLINPAA